MNYAYSHKSSRALRTGQYRSKPISIFSALSITSELSAFGATLFSTAGSALDYV